MTKVIKKSENMVEYYEQLLKKPYFIEKYNTAKEVVLYDDCVRLNYKKPEEVGLGEQYGEEFYKIKS